MKNERLPDLTVVDVHKDIVVPHSEITERYISDTDFGAAIPPFSPTTIVNPADMEIDEGEDETEESDTCEDLDDGDDMEFVADNTFTKDEGMSLIQAQTPVGTCWFRPPFNAHACVCTDRDNCNVYPSIGKDSKGHLVPSVKPPDANGNIIPGSGAADVRDPVQAEVSNNNGNNNNAEGEETSSNATLADLGTVGNHSSPDGATKHSSGGTYLFTVLVVTAKFHFDFPAISLL
ncbi:hypothetical protein RvY_06695 [Ramazzottius varieornatus]|uniref:Uncharacterized protein n=1 Tax=Ramazzottius varieornatus TaxID=947166 RepID=A0A1D1V2U1_RAMVA|nr:hypothetical protein RvY_06695 [Ramazzottius varieornatus]